MKNHKTLAKALLCAAVLGCQACDPNGGNPGPQDDGYSAGDMKTHTVGTVSFKMAYVPKGLTSPIGHTDGSSFTVLNDYWIGETEVTYEVWKAVYDWAVDEARGTDRYSFANPGQKGSGDSSCTEQHPVTYITWGDAAAWCNALTEWYNAEHGASLECVYTREGTVVRDSNLTLEECRDIEETKYLQSYEAPEGFRLPANVESELAARYRDGTLWTYGDHASGDESGACYDNGTILGGMGLSSEFYRYAVYPYEHWFPELGTAFTYPVKSALHNALGLYDMSGNVNEWTEPRIRG